MRLNDFFALGALDDRLCDIKAQAAALSHKSDAGGVILDIADATALKAAYEGIISNARDYNSGADVKGVQIQHQLDAAREVIVGAVTDPVFGKLVAFGLGGILVEVLKDVTFRLAPTSAEVARSMLDDIAGAEILDGVRGAAGVNRAALTSLIVKVSQLITDFPAIDQLDLNPIFASSTGATAVDARILLKEPAAPRYRPSQEEILAAVQVSP